MAYNFDLCAMKLQNGLLAYGIFSISRLYKPPIRILLLGSYEKLAYVAYKIAMFEEKCILHTEN